MNVLKILFLLNDLLIKHLIFSDLKGTTLLHVIGVLLRQFLPSECELWQCEHYCCSSCVTMIWSLSVRAASNPVTDRKHGSLHVVIHPRNDASVVKYADSLLFWKNTWIENTSSKMDFSTLVWNTHDYLKQAFHFTKVFSLVNSAAICWCCVCLWIWSLLRCEAICLMVQIADTVNSLLTRAHFGLIGCRGECLCIGLHDLGK